MTGYDYKIGLKKTLKNVGVILTPAIALELVNNFVQIIPAEYVVAAQLAASAVAYFIKNASENGAWK